LVEQRAEGFLVESVELAISRGPPEGEHGEPCEEQSQGQQHEHDSQGVFLTVVI
jgi:hypothetical protein